MLMSAWGESDMQRVVNEVCHELTIAESHFAMFMVSPCIWMTNVIQLYAVIC